MTLILVILVTFVLLTLAVGALQRLAEHGPLHVPAEARHLTAPWPIYDPLDPFDPHYRSRHA